MDARSLNKVISRANRGGTSKGVAGKPGLVNITYAKKTTGNVVSRAVRPYEVRGGTLYATDTVHGAGRIHTFHTRRVLAASPSRPKSTFRPVWAVQTPGLTRKG